MRRKWLRWLFLPLALLLAGSFGLSLALRGGWARRGLQASLSAGFGRPVEVGRFGFSLLSGPRLEAQSVTVYDDPRFGQEYFLRAERLTAGVRWSALLRGRFEFDTVSLTRPSLNLVRLADGQWNIESWLPPLPAGASAARAAAGGAAPASAEATAGGPAGRLSRIEVESGRINFKRDSRKLPLALVAVDGRFDHDAAGHWNIDVQANPMRAPASLQEAGTLRVRGVVGGVSTRLRPANLSLSWEEASLADLSRLARGRDYGIRGTLDAELTARIDDSPVSSWGEWSVQGKIRLQNVHGWALAGRAGDPSTDVSFSATWRPAEYRLLVTRCLVEAPQSRLSATIDLDWSREFRPVAQVTSSRVAFADLLAWRRAFRSAGAGTDDLAVEGSVEAQASLSGWPLRVDDVDVASAGATIRSAVLPGPIRVGPIVTEWRGGALRIRSTPVFLPVALAASPARGAAALDSPPSSSALLVEASLGPLPAMDAVAGTRYRLAVSGSAHRAQDLLAVARAWSGSTSASWAAEGPVSLQVAWAGSFHSGTSAASGTIQARGLQLTTALLNRPMLVADATIELRGYQRRINLKSLEALGAHWRGSLRAPAEDGSWDFDLAADRLDAAEFYAWLGAPARPSLLQRILPFGASPDSAAPEVRADALETLQARGRLRVAELSFSPLLVERIDAEAVVDGASIALREGHADLYDGRLTGNFQARLAAEPEYTFDGRFDRIDLDAVGAAVALPVRLNGLATGDLKLSARGSDRAALAASLQGQGLLRARDAVFEPREPEPASVLADAFSGLDRRPFALTSRFQIASGRIRLDQLLLVRAGEQTEVTGAVDFSRRLDLRARSVPHSAAAVAAAGVALDSWTISGTLDAPRIVAAPVPAPAPATTRSGNGVPSARR